MAMAAIHVLCSLLSLFWGETTLQSCREQTSESLSAEIQRLSPEEDCVVREVSTMQLTEQFPASDSILTVSVLTLFILFTPECRPICLLERMALMSFLCGEYMERKGERLAAFLSLLLSCDAPPPDTLPI